MTNSNSMCPGPHKGPIPGLLRLGGICLDCAKDEMALLEKRRQELLQALAKIESLMREKAAAISGPIPMDIYRNVQHKCICGLSFHGYMSLVAHISTEPDESSHGVFLSKEETPKKETPSLSRVKFDISKIG